MAFEIRPNRALKVIIIQAEDGYNDQIRMATMLNHMGLTEEEKQQVGANCHILPCSGLTDDGFFEMLEGLVQDLEPNLIIINLLHSYVSGDVKDTKTVKDFLRVNLTPLLQKYSLGAILLHHTTKQNYRNTDGWKAQDFMYGCAGDAEITNWARMMIAIEPTDDIRVYKMIAAKRWNRSEWTDFAKHIAYSTDPNVMMWIAATDEEAKASTHSTTKVKPMELFDLIPDCGIITPSDWETAAINEFGISKDTFKKVRVMLSNPKKEGYKKFVAFNSKDNVWYLTPAGCEQKGILDKSAASVLSKYWTTTDKTATIKIKEPDVF